MDNRDVAAVFTEMADLLDIEGREQYRVRAFRRIARMIESLSEPLGELLKFGRLESLPGLGPGAARRVKDILRTGTCADLDRLRRAVPPGLRELPQVDGVGPKTARLAWQWLGVSSLDELEAAARAGRLVEIPGVSDKAQDKILRGITDHRTGRSGGRLRLDEALARGGAIVRALTADASVLRADLTGSARRRKEMVDDLDVLVACFDARSVIARFVSLPGVQSVLVRGERSRVRIESGQQVDLRIIGRENYGAALHYFTGSKLHNIAVRLRAQTRYGLRISEHGVFRKDDDLCLSQGRQEEEIFAAVGLPWIPPELRENTGEIEAAEAGRLPRLVTPAEVVGDLHVHTSCGEGRDGAADVIGMARALGVKYVAITDRHARVAASLRDGGADGLRALSGGGLTVLAGVEVDILPDGRLDADIGLLQNLDFVIAAVRTHLDLDRAAMTERVVRAVESGVVDCIAHPGGRVVGGRAAWMVDMERIFRAAKKMEVALELNSDPMRFDLEPVHCRRARDLGVAIAVNSDARAAAELARRTLGVEVARRGWLEARDVLNAQPVEVVVERRRARLRRVGIAVPVISSARSEAVVVNRDASLGGEISLSAGKIKTNQHNFSRHAAVASPSWFRLRRVREIGSSGRGNSIDDVPPTPPETLRPLPDLPISPISPPRRLPAISTPARIQHPPPTIPPRSPTRSAPIACEAICATGSRATSNPAAIPSSKPRSNASPRIHCRRHSSCSKNSHSDGRPRSPDLYPALVLLPPCQEQSSKNVRTPGHRPPSGEGGSVSPTWATNSSASFGVEQRLRTVSTST